MLPNPLYHAQVPPGGRWAISPVLRPLVPLRHALPGIRMGTEGYRIDPSSVEAGVAINEENSCGGSS